MTQKPIEFQPSLILLDVLLGAFRMRGTNFEAWCKSQGHNSMNLRNAALGASRTPAGLKMLNEAIDAAGRDFVSDAYLRRVAEHYAQIKGAK